MATEIDEQSEEFKKDEVAFLNWLMLTRPEAAQAVDMAIDGEDEEGALAIAKQLLLQLRREMGEKEHTEGETQGEADDGKAGASKAVVEEQPSARAEGSEQPPPAKRPRTGPGPARCVFIVVVGLRGSGKSTLCHILREILQGTWLNYDEFAHKNPDRTGKGVRQIFGEELRACITRSLAHSKRDKNMRLVLVDRDAPTRSQRQEALMDLKRVNWRQRGGKVFLIEFSHSADTFGYGADSQLSKRCGEQHVALCASRVEERGAAHHTYWPSPKLRASLHKAAREMEAVSGEELTCFDEKIALDIELSPSEAALQVLGRLRELGWLEQLAQRSDEELRPKVELAWHAYFRAERHWRAGAAAAAEPSPHEDWRSQCRRAAQADRKEAKRKAAELAEQQSQAAAVAAEASGSTAPAADGRPPAEAEAEQEEGRERRASPEGKEAAEQQVERPAKGPQDGPHAEQGSTTEEEEDAQDKSRSAATEGQQAESATVSQRPVERMAEAPHPPPLAPPKPAEQSLQTELQPELPPPLVPPQPTQQLRQPRLQPHPPPFAPPPHLLQPQPEPQPQVQQPPLQPPVQPRPVVQQPPVEDPARHLALSAATLVVGSSSKAAPPAVSPAVLPPPGIPAVPPPPMVPGLLQPPVVAAALPPPLVPAVPPPPPAPPKAAPQPVPLPPQAAALPTAEIAPATASQGSRPRRRWLLELPEVARVTKVPGMLQAEMEQVARPHVQLLPQDYEQRAPDRQPVAIETLEASEGDSFTVQLESIVIIAGKAACGLLSLPAALPCLVRPAHVVMGIRPDVHRGWLADVLEAMVTGDVERRFPDEKINRVQLPKSRTMQGRLVQEALEEEDADRGEEPC